MILTHKNYVVMSNLLGTCMDDIAEYPKSFSSYESKGTENIDITITKTNSELCNSIIDEQKLLIHNFMFLMNSQKT